MKKKCKKCGEEKEPSGFYKGYAVCKTCTSNKNKNTAKKRKESFDSFLKTFAV